MLGFAFNFKVVLLSLFLVNSYNGLIESMQSINDKSLHTYTHKSTNCLKRGKTIFNAHILLH